MDCSLGETIPAADPGASFGKYSHAGFCDTASMETIEDSMKQIKTKLE